MKASESCRTAVTVGTSVAARAAGWLRLLVVPWRQVPPESRASSRQPPALAALELELELEPVLINLKEPAPAGPGPLRLMPVEATGIGRSP